MYSQAITHLHRTAFIIAIDCSSSMQETTMLNNKEMRKAEAVAIVCNYIIDELLERATRRSEVRNYYDISVIGYQQHDIAPIIPDNCYKFISISELSHQAKRHKAWCFTENSSEENPDFLLREWIKPTAMGLTPMHTALTHIYTLLNDWCSKQENRNSFPPIVFNISDGEANDATPAELIEIAEQIRQTGTEDGNTLFINIHLGKLNDVASEIFPSDGDFVPQSEYQLTLFRMSSLMPKELESIIDEVTTHKGQRPYRGAAFNVTPGELLNILNIGSESINIA
jgi:hypothetical protein